MSESITPETTVAELLHERLNAVRAADPQEELPSPCIGVCRLDEARDWCAGCLRTREELRVWRGLDAAGRREVWSRIEARLAAGAVPMP